MAKCILVVEDDYLNAKLLRAVLETTGFNVLLERSGAPVIELALSAPPDLFLIDLLLPDIPGLSLIRRLRALPIFSTTPIIACTVLSAQEVERDALSSGVNLFLRKPVSMNALLASIKGQVS